MIHSLNNEKPIFQQIRERIEDAILDGQLQPDDRIPSTNEFAKEYQINPATAGKGVNELVDKGIIYKKRGVGMFVHEDARKILVTERKENFFRQHIEPLKKEASRLGISDEELQRLIQGG
ncbi:MULTISPECIES: GntR family transcriptional regulator [Lysinibacillus]|uniref:GntR family transcriptional regulator n=1 Tax=Lysinibacillus irui TaxID=2998077 RepID=A0AAJ5UX72_9BACI|nr:MULTISPECIES: GntR family transcriptional regulator [Lysinibacillus]MEA0563414.1 GntR family transcriptional regulator [Lysinibacillus irui]WDV07975.1 GntR family transcriptional regulator [Lysinibacillus irui]